MIDPEIDDILRRAGAPVPFASVPLEQLRAALARSVASWSGVPREVTSVRDTSFPTSRGPLAVRIYEPNVPRPAPALVYFHGGGWVRGDVTTTDAVCRTLALDAGCVVVNVDYRLAPEHRFPAAIEDAFDALVWTTTNLPGVDPARIAVGGDSSGGNIAAALTQMTRDRGGPSIACQLLVCPVLDQSGNAPSYTEFSGGPFLTRENMRWCWDQYLASPQDGLRPYASPLRGDLTKLPPAFIATAENDPVRDDGENYAAALRAAGVAVQHTRYVGAVHGFWLMRGRVDLTRRAHADAARVLRETLGSHPVSA